MDRRQQKTRKAIFDALGELLESKRFENITVQEIIVLYHLRESKSNLKGILGGESGELFLGFLKQYLHVLFGRYKAEFDPSVPEDFLLHHLSGSFAEAVKWWMAEDTKHSPEEVASFYMTMIGKLK